MYTHTEATQSSMTPSGALGFLKEGNERFRRNLKANRDLLAQVNSTRDGQWPFAVVLSCIDSRVSAELIFDQGLGDIFSVRIAGNFVNDDILGSMEFGCRVAGAKLVLGHTDCGAIKGACDNVVLGHLTALLAKLQPAVDATHEPSAADQRNSGNVDFVQAVARENVRRTVANVLDRSAILRDMCAEGLVEIVGAMYDVKAGEVEFQD